EFPDLRLRDPDVTKDLRQYIRELIQTVNPKTVYSFGPDGVSRHRDHIRIGEVTWEVIQAHNNAYQQTPSKQIELLQAQLSDQSKQIFQDCLKPSGIRNWRFPLTAVKIDLSPYLSKITQALNVYQSQWTSKERAGFEDYYKRNPVVEFIRPKVGTTT
nr:PIG-L family deacetylase [Vampirovibrio sp.]